MDNITTMDLLTTEDVAELVRYANATSTPIDINNSTTRSLPAELSEAALWLYFTMRIIWAFMAVFGNSLTILAVTRFERLQTCTNYLICSLAVSDLLSVLVVPLMMVQELNSATWYFVPVCLLEKTFSIISSAGNMFSILYLSIDRYIYIALPLRYHTLVTPHRVVTLLTLTCCWCLLSIPALVFMANHLQVGMRCSYHIFLNNWVRNIYIAPVFAVVVFLTIGFHLAIARIAHRQARLIQVQQQPYETLDVAINRSTKKISRTLAAVLGLYVVCIVPQTVVAQLNLQHYLAVERFTVLLYWANAWANPLIYAWRLKDFKIAFKKIFTGSGSFIEVPGIPA